MREKKGRMKRGGEKKGSPRYILNTLEGTKPSGAVERTCIKEKEKGRYGSFSPSRSSERTRPEARDETCSRERRGKRGKSFAFIQRNTLVQESRLQLHPTAKGREEKGRSALLSPLTQTSDRDQGSRICEEANRKRRREGEGEKKGRRHYL